MKLPVPWTVVNVIAGMMAAAADVVVLAIPMFAGRQMVVVPVVPVIPVGVVVGDARFAKAIATDTSRSPGMSSLR